MSDIVRLQTQAQIDNEAAVWAWRLDSGTLTAADQGRLEAWLREDVRHRKAFEELSRTWKMLDRIGERAVPDEATVDIGRTGRLSAPAYWKAAAAIVLAIALGSVLWITRRPGMQTLSTAVGQERHVVLADGSQVTLNTNTLLFVALTPGRRDIYLRRGEAHFNVVHDAARPLFVHSGDALIRDVGTQFEVRLYSSRDVDVIVDEGRVVVVGEGRADGARAVRAGQRLVMDGSHLSILSVSPQQMTDELAWRTGALIFQGEPLSQAIAEVGRYTRAHIVLAGPKVASLQVSGRFRTDDVPGFLKALQAALPVRISRAGPQVIYIAGR
ncbi:MAG: FecR family protein [Steroidobacteraceae bacterium]